MTEREVVIHIIQNKGDCHKLSCLSKADKCPFDMGTHCEPLNYVKLTSKGMYSTPEAYAEVFKRATLYLLGNWKKQ